MSPAGGVVARMSMVRGCNLNIVLQVPDAVAHSRRDIWLATLAHNGSGSSTVAGAFGRRLGGILHKRTRNRMLQDISNYFKNDRSDCMFILRITCGR